MPLINLKQRKQIKSKRKRTKSSAKVPKEGEERKERNGPKERKLRKEPREPRKKGERQKNISAKELIASSMELKCDICQVQVNTWRELRQHFLLAHTRTPYIKCCDTIYEKQRPLADHLQWHKDPDAFK